MSQFSQFKSRFRPSSSKDMNRDANVKLHMHGGDYPSKNYDSAHYHRQMETQRIKNLSFWDNTDSKEDDEPEWKERQSPMPFILGIVILVVASTSLWLLFRWASGDNMQIPPIIAADTAPFKVRPENPGGMMIPHQDKLIYGRLRQETVQPIERLLPPPEQPMMAPVLPPPPMNAPPMAQPPMDQHGNPLAMPVQQQQPYQTQAQIHPQGQGYMPSPNGYVPPNQPMSQVSQPQNNPYPPSPQPSQGEGAYPQQQHRGHASYPAPLYPPSPYGPSSGTQVAQPTMPHAPLKAASNPVVPKLPTTVEAIKPASDEEENEPVTSSDDGKSELDQLIAREAETPLKRSVKKNENKSVKLLPLDPGKYKVQIASLPSRVMAEHEMKRLRNQHKATFQNKPWHVQRVNLGPDRGYTHRLVVGSFSKQEAAIKFCKKLRAEKIGCRVVAPSTH